MPATEPSFWHPDSHAKLKSSKTYREAWGGSLPTTTTLGTLLEKDLPPSYPVVSPWLHSGESCLLWGGTGSGKSMIALTVALGVAGGGEALGWKFPKPTKVLWIDGEQSERDLKRRVPLLTQSIAGLDSALAEKNLFIMARAAQDSGTKFFDVANNVQAELLTADVERLGIGLVVLDNLSTLSDSIKQENEAASFKPMQTLLTQLKKMNVAVILVHHAGKNPKAYRGSSSIATTFERILGIVHNEASPPTVLDVTVTLEKFRDEVPDDFQPMFPLKFSKEKQENGTFAPRWQVGQLTLLDTAWRMFADGSFRTVAEFVAAYNARFDKKHSAGNFSRDFCTPWLTQLRKSTSEIRAARDRMGELKGFAEDDEPTEAGEKPAF